MADKLSDEEVDILLGGPVSPQESAASPDLNLLLQLSDWRIQGLVCYLDHEELLQVLLSAAEPVREKILRNLSERRRALLLEEMEQPGKLEAETSRELGDWVARMAGEWIEKGEAAADAPEAELAPLRERLRQLGREIGRPRLELSAVGGAFFALLLAAGGPLLGKGLFAPVPSLIGVLLGGLAALWMVGGWQAPWKLVRIAGRVIRRRHPDAVWIAYLVYCAQMCRTCGILVLDTKEVGFDRLVEPRLREWLQLAIDGTEPERIGQIALTDIAGMEQRHRAGQQLLTVAAGGALLCGILGLGLGAMLLPEAQWRAAMLFPLWGLLAGGLLLGLRCRLRRDSAAEARQRRLMVEGIQGIQAGERPGQLRLRLAALVGIPPSAVETAAQEGFAAIRLDAPEEKETMKKEETGETKVEEVDVGEEEETRPAEEEEEAPEMEEEQSEEEDPLELAMLAAMAQEEEVSRDREAGASGNTREQEAPAEIQEEAMAAATGGGPEVERVKALLVAEEQVLFAGVKSGLYRSVDNGETWEETGLMGQEITALAELAGVLLAGAIEEDLLLPVGGIFRSADGGRTWTEVDRGFEVHAFAGWGPILYAGAGRLQRSLDGGRTWRQMDSLERLVYALRVDEWRLYAGTNRGVFRSADGGESWESAGLDDTEVGALAVSGEILLAGTASGLFLSRDRGERWTDQRLTEKSVCALRCAGETLYAGTDDGVFHSGDGGNNWSRLEPAGVPVNALALFGGRLLLGSDGGVLSIAG